jgi:hypothetical protein
MVASTSGMSLPAMRGPVAAPMTRLQGAPRRLVQSMATPGDKGAKEPGSEQGKADFSAYWSLKIKASRLPPCGLAAWRPLCRLAPHEGPIICAIGE